MVITRGVLAKGLDSQTAFEIVSIDIADIDVGENIGAKLQGAQTNADVRITVASAEKRRAMAVAREQEMVAVTRQYQAETVLAEAEIPAAMAVAYAQGQLRSEQPSRRIQTASRAAGSSPLSSRKPEHDPLRFSPAEPRSINTEAWETDGGTAEIRDLSPRPRAGSLHCNPPRFRLFLRVL